MGILSLVLGIVALVAGLMPGCSYLFLLICCIGLTAGLISLHERKSDPGVAIAGIVFNGYATVMILMWAVIFALGTISATNDAIGTENAVLGEPGAAQTIILHHPQVAPPAQAPQDTTAPAK